MTPTPGVNTHNPQKWAAVVSGTAWKRWGVNDAGTLTAEYIRGPLIIWAAPKPGEEEEGPQVQAPKPTALDMRVCELNTARQWEKVKAAARGKIKQLSPISADLEYRNEEIRKNIKETARVRRDLEALSLKLPEICDSDRNLFFSIIAGFKHVIRLQTARLARQIAFKKLLIFRLMTAICRTAHYRAHALKRVKPAPRRGRIPRPAHAVPRPPCAPCAPPAA